MPNGIRQNLNIFFISIKKRIVILVNYTQFVIQTKFRKKRKWVNLPWTNLPWTNIDRTNLLWMNLPWICLPWTNLPWTNLPWTNLPVTGPLV